MFQTLKNFLNSYEGIIEWMMYTIHRTAVFKAQNSQKLRRSHSSRRRQVAAVAVAEVGDDESQKSAMTSHSSRRRQVTAIAQEEEKTEEP